MIRVIDPPASNRLRTRKHICTWAVSLFLLFVVAGLCFVANASVYKAKFFYQSTLRGSGETPMLCCCHTRIVGHHAEESRYCMKSRLECGLTSNFSKTAATGAQRSGVV